jgi:hypothetical protein
MTERDWKRLFDEPIEVDGRELVTLLDAGKYITALPRKEHDVPEWQARRCSRGSASCAR